MLLLLLYSSWSILFIWPDKYETDKQNTHDRMYVLLFWSCMLLVWKSGRAFSAEQELSWNNLLSSFRRRSEAPHLHYIVPKSGTFKPYSFTNIDVILDDIFYFLALSYFILSFSTLLSINFNLEF